MSGPSKQSETKTVFSGERLPLRRAAPITAASGAAAPSAARARVARRRVGAAGSAGAEATAAIAVWPEAAPSAKADGAARVRLRVDAPRVGFAPFWVAAL